MKTLAISLACLSSAVLAANTCCGVDELYVFGDSLVDQGIQPGAPNVERPNGQMQVQILNDQLLGLRPIESSAPNMVPNPNGNNFAQSSAGIVGPPGDPQPIPWQIVDAIQRQGGFNDHQLFYVIGGGNDTQNAGGGDPLGPYQEGRNPQTAPVLSQSNQDTQNLVRLTPEQAAQIPPAWIRGLNSLHDAGGEYIITNADLFFPDPVNLNVSTGVRLGPLIEQVNRQMREAVNALPFDVIQEDAVGWYQMIRNDPARFGLNVTNPSYQQGTGAPPLYIVPTPVNVNGFMWFEGLHMVTPGYRLWADYTYSILEGPGFMGALSQAPRSLVVVQQQTILNRLDPLAGCRCPCTWEFFVEGGYSPLLHEPSEYLSFDQSAGHITVGGINQRTACLAYGGALSYSFGDVKFDNSKGNADLHLISALLFGQWQTRTYYVNAVGNVGINLYRGINRTFPIGNASFLARGETEGFAGGLAVNGAYWMCDDGCFKTGPAFILDYQHTELDGFTETNALVANLHYRAIKRNWVGTGIGWEGVGNWVNPCGCLRVFANGFIYKQWVDGRRDVFFNVASMPGSHGRLPSINQRGEVLFLGNLGLSRPVCAGGDFTVTYNVRAGSYDTQYHTILLGLSWGI
jgi:phospholipase/lecithinase/hemolysin